MRRIATKTNLKPNLLIASIRRGNRTLNHSSTASDQSTGFNGGSKCCWLKPESANKLIAKLLTAHKVSLPGIDPADIEADRLLAERLAPVATELGSLQRLVQDTILQANHERWSATTAGYTSLVRTMDANPELREALKPALDAFGVGRKRSPRKGSGGSGG